MQTIPYDKLGVSDLYVDACYEGGRLGHAGDDPFPRLLKLDSQGGFRFRGKVSSGLEMLALV